MSQFGTVQMWGKSAGIDNILAELVQAGGEDVITALTTITTLPKMCQKNPPLPPKKTKNKQQPHTHKTNDN